MQGLRIIMLGKLRSGKSTAGKMICESFKEIGITLNSKPLAKPIYEEAKTFYERHDLIWRKNRRLLEGIGEALNDDYPNGDKIIELYKKDFNCFENIYVEDCRRLTQTNFFAALNKPVIWDNVSGLGAQMNIGRSIFIRVNASDEVRKSRCKPGEWTEGHITDTELENWEADFEIDNNENNQEILKHNVSTIVKLIYDKKDKLPKNVIRINNLIELINKLR